MTEDEFERKYLAEYFDSLSDSTRTELLIEFFQELQIQEIVGGTPINEEELEEYPDMKPYWAHTGEPLA